MKFIPRQYLYLLIMSAVFLGLLLSFSIDYIIPSGKQYRKQKLAVHTLSKRVEKLYLAKTDINKKYNKFSKKHTAVLTAFSNTFNAGKFIETNKQYFQKITLTKLKKDKQFDVFDTYRVNAVSKIHSPENFYKFLQQINHEGWIIKIEFPIHFQRDGRLIDLDFTMRVYKRLLKDSSSNILNKS